MTFAYAITVQHKAQGFTVAKAVLNIARKDFVLRLTYVSVSRAMTLLGLMFEEPFNLVDFRILL
jgi:ATP-dependent exoDNAse (exonuclease V) alpha subunit